MDDFFKAISSRLSNSLSPAQIGDQLANMLEKVVIAGATFLAFYIFWLILGSAMRQVMKRAEVDETAARFALTMTKVVLLAIGFINALAAIGIDTASVLTSLGIAGITIGFAARDGLSNIISGIFIFWDRPFVIGDLIESGGHYGRVEDITLRSTRVITPDGKMLSIPNSQMVNSTVASYTNFPHLRIEVSVTVAPAENLERVRKLLLSIVEVDDAFLSDPAPRVLVTDLGDYNVTLVMQAWLKDERAHVAERAGLREKALKLLTESSVEMPFETISIEPIEIQRVNQEVQ